MKPCPAIRPFSLLFNTSRIRARFKQEEGDLAKQIVWNKILFIAKKNKKHT